MPNKNYAKGRRLEYSIKKKLEKEGFTVFRTAGSHSACDLIAVNQKTIRFIQLKSSKKERKPYDSETDKFIKYLPRLPFGFHRELWIKVPREKEKITIVETVDEAWG